jgi:hypothetical protein
MSDAPKRNHIHPPAMWVCPKCGSRVVTHVDTYPVECRHKSHHREQIVMVPQEVSE